MKRFVHLFLWAGLILATPVGTQEWQRFSGAGVVVEARQRYARFARNLARDFHKRVQDVKDQLSLAPPPEVNVTVGHDAKDLSQRLKVRLRPWTAGVSIKPKRRIGLNADSMRPPTAMPAAVILRHELTHQAIGEHLGPKKRIPLWLEEGICQWVAGTAYLGVRADLMARLNFDDLLTWSDISERFPEDRNTATFAYLQSFSFVSYLARIRGSRFLLDLVDITAEGVPVDQAILSLTGKAQVDLEKEWIEFEKGRSLGLLNVIHTVGPLVACAFLVILAFLCRRRAARVLLSKMEEDEGMEAARGDSLRSPPEAPAARNRTGEYHSP